jgi:hypothetical protein
MTRIVVYAHRPKRPAAKKPAKEPKAVAITQTVVVIPDEKRARLLRAERWAAKPREPSPEVDACMCRSLGASTLGSASRYVGAPLIASHGGRLRGSADACAKVTGQVEYLWRAQLHERLEPAAAAEVINETWAQQSELAEKGMAPG